MSFIGRSVALFASFEQTTNDLTVPSRALISAAMITCALVSYRKTWLRLVFRSADSIAGRIIERVENRA
jgi:hypothetical protein